jgi:hypothetical protein
VPSRCREEEETQGEVAEGEEKDATLDLLLKHPDIRQMKHLKHASETLKKHLKNT